MIEYENFVISKTSQPSLNFYSLIDRLHELREVPGVSVSALITGAMGLASESGEFQEIVKKILFQGKPLDEANIYHMRRELGDIMFYLALACAALGTSIEEVSKGNMEKLEARYAGGFKVQDSEVRAEGDL